MFGRVEPVLVVACASFSVAVGLGAYFVGYVVGVDDGASYAKESACYDWCGKKWSGMDGEDFFLCLDICDERGPKDGDAKGSEGTGPNNGPER